MTPSHRFFVLVALFCIGFISGAKAQVDIVAEDGKTEVLRIAGGAPNRIVTPYEEPAFVTNVEHEAWSVGNVVYILPMQEQGMMAGFIQDKSGQAAISVAFEIANIPPQQIRLQDPEFEPLVKADGEKLAVGDSGTHIDRLVDILVAALNKGQIPGFRQLRPQQKELYVGPFRMVLQHAQRRGDVIVERHEITHEGMEIRTISEASFQVPGRQAVMIYPPMTEIAPEQKAMVFIVRRFSDE